MTSTRATSASRRRARARAASSRPSSRPHTATDAPSSRSRCASGEPEPVGPAGDEHRRVRSARGPSVPPGPARPSRPATRARHPSARPRHAHARRAAPRRRDARRRGSRRGRAAGRRAAGGRGTRRSAGGASAWVVHAHAMTDVLGVEAARGCAIARGCRSTAPRGARRGAASGATTRDITIGRGRSKRTTVSARVEEEVARPGGSCRRRPRTPRRDRRDRARRTPRRAAASSRAGGRCRRARRAARPARAGDRAAPSSSCPSRSCRARRRDARRRGSCATTADATVAMVPPYDPRHGRGGARDLDRHATGRRRVPRVARRDVGPPAAPAVPAGQGRDTGDDRASSWPRTSSAACVCQYVAGRVADRVGRRPVLIAGLVCLRRWRASASSCRSTPLAYGALRFVQGGAAGSVEVATLATVALVVPDSQRGRASSRIYAAQLGGAAVRPAARCVRRRATRWRTSSSSPRWPRPLAALPVLRSDLGPRQARRRAARRGSCVDARLVGAVARRRRRRRRRSAPTSRAGRCSCTSRARRRSSSGSPGRCSRCPTSFFFRVGGWFADHSDRRVLAVVGVVNSAAFCAIYPLLGPVERAARAQLLRGDRHVARAARRPVDPHRGRRAAGGRSAPGGLRDGPDRRDRDLGARLGHPVRASGPPCRSSRWRSSSVAVVAVVPLAWRSVSRVASRVPAALTPPP